jgi:hypothetical protein
MSGMKFSKRFGGHNESSGHERSSRPALPRDFWCVECEATGLIPVTYVSTHGRVNRGSAVCRCQAGDTMNDGKRLMYQRGVELGVIDPQARTKSAHWMFSMRRWFELIGDEKSLALLEHIVSSDNPVDALHKWWEKYPPHGPMSGITRGVYGRS